MCGIVGILARDDTSSPLTPERLDAIVTRIEGLLSSMEGRLFSETGNSPGLSGAHDGSVVPAELDGAFGELRSFDTVFLAGADTAVSAALCGLTNRLDLLLDRVDGALEVSRSIAGREALNDLKIHLLDARWLIHQDIGGAVDSVRELFGSSWTMADRTLVHHYWRLDNCLRNVGRIEVRGRDSAGLSVMTSFEDSAGYRSFLDSLSPEQAGELESRKSRGDFAAFSVIGGDFPGFIFTYKVAEEIGRMGDNVARLRKDIASDELLRLALSSAGCKSNVLAHTRWASNGVISEPNAHPQDSRAHGDSAEKGRICAVLNGDIDNYRKLLEEYTARTGRMIDSSITTDAKIIPLLIGEAYGKGMDFPGAFRSAVNRFEGSFAIAVHHLDEPSKIYLALKGSGQSLYIGTRHDAVVVASELYGVVETTPTFVKMDGEWRGGENGTGGQIFVLDQDEIGSARPFEGFALDGSRLPAEAMVERRAEITTRDICLGDWSHYFLKEVNEAVSSVGKTLRGRIDTEAGTATSGDAPEVARSRPSLLLDESVVPAGLLDDFMAGRIRKLYCIGQGTAGVAAAGVAVAMKRYLDAMGLDIEALRASELSAHYLSERMDDCLVVAVSQSGTTADTNRTVDLARTRGARCISIVNRRNSDLVYKSDGVLYTSDGRDVEMSVASTKAFYSQVTAGYLLALYLAERCSVLGPKAVRRAVEALKRLPSALATVMEKRDEIARVAEEHALRRMHWACVGSGPNHVAAQEIRIKLSELCYKSIACDFLEDKKHIDLSSEPMILVCATGLDSVTLGDAVKEAAIFKAHRSIPIVFTTEGTDDFDPYAAAVIKCPAVGEGLDFIPEVMAGHLFGFYAARAIDATALPLRSLRKELVDCLSGPARRPNPALIRSARSEVLTSGKATAALDSATACRLYEALFTLEDEPDTPGSGNARAADAPLSGGKATQNVLDLLTEAINQLTRPIDAIKHQAKTVTVGITREELRLEGPMARVFEELEIPQGRVCRSSMELLRALSPLVAEVQGASLYKVEGLTGSGLPTSGSICRRVAGWGGARQWKSRTDGEKAPLLKGTKWLCLKERAPFVGVGRKDRRTIVIVPLAPEPGEGADRAGLLLFHVRFTDTPSTRDLVRALKSYGDQYDRLMAAATELDIEWNDELLARVPVVELFGEAIDTVFAGLD